MECRQIVEILKQTNRTISFMESCTGGFLANEITNISGASDILRVSLVTYSNEYKIKFNVDKEIIDKYTVYSNETSEEMAKKVSQFAKSSIGIGVTGEMGNTTNKSPKVYYTIYLKDNNEIINDVIDIKSSNRIQMKQYVAEEIFNKLLEILKQ